MKEKTEGNYGKNWQKWRRKEKNRSRKEEKNRERKDKRGRKMEMNEKRTHASFLICCTYWGMFSIPPVCLPTGWTVALRSTCMPSGLGDTAQPYAMIICHQTVLFPKHQRIFICYLPSVPTQISKSFPATPWFSSYHFPHYLRPPLYATSSFPQICSTKGYSRWNI
jgi:hypothetical protein